MKYESRDREDKVSIPTVEGGLQSPPPPPPPQLCRQVALQWRVGGLISLIHTTILKYSRKSTLPK